MSKFEIIPVKTKKDRLKFIRMAWPIYKNDPHWVPPLIFDQVKFLDPELGVFFDHGEVNLFLALRDNIPVGRISAHINNIHDECYNDNKGFFGFFECENNVQTAGALFDAAEDYLRQKGKKYIEGPFSFNIYDEIGILIDGFDTDPYVLNTHNPSYYKELFEMNGFKKSVDWFAFRGRKGRMDVNLQKKVIHVKERIENNLKIKTRFIEKKSIKKDAVTIKEIFSEAWEKNWGHLNLTEREWKRIESAVIKIAILPLCIIAEVNGKPVGFALSIYDINVAIKKMNGRLFPFGFIHMLNFKKTNRFRLLLMGVLEEYRNRGIEIAMYLSIMERAVKYGFVEAEMSLIVETNEPMINSLHHFDVEKYKTYRIFIKEIN